MTLGWESYSDLYATTRDKIFFDVSVSRDEDKGYTRASQKKSFPIR